MADGGIGVKGDLVEATDGPAVPDYLERYYWWAYLRPASLRVFDHPFVVSAILWGQYRRLCEAALAEIRPGERVLQLACVYGDLTTRLRDRLGAQGRLEVVDVAPIQIDNLSAKLGRDHRVVLRVADAAVPGTARFDTVLCFFLLHELPDDQKLRVVDTALDQMAEGGRAVFVDYAQPAWWHPIRPITWAVFALLEPFAATMWRGNIRSLSSMPDQFRWRNTRLFGGLYQIVVAERAG